MILPAILETKLEEIEKKKLVLEQFSEVVHLDISDGVNFEGKTLTDLEQLNKLKFNKNLEIHLLVENPSYYVKNLSIGDLISSQIEAENIDQFIKEAKEKYKKVGLSIAPYTPVETLFPYVDKVDYVQFMTVVPGGQGRGFEDSVIKNIQDFKQKFPGMWVQVDGGITNETLPKVLSAGADSAAVGSYIVKADNPRARYENLNIVYKEFSIKSMIDSILPKDDNNSCVTFGNKMLKVGFLGGAAWEKEDQPYIDAFNTAKILAENSYEIVNGGGPGVMRASTLGAQAGGGRVLAITYHPNKPKKHYEGVDLLNTFDEEVRTLDYFDRTKVMLQATDAHIVFNGSLGTMSELGMSWISSWIHEPNNKPIILYGEFWQKYIDYIKENMLLTNDEEHIIKICNTPEEVLEYLNKLCQSQN